MEEVFFAIICIIVLLLVICIGQYIKDYDEVNSRLSMNEQNFVDSYKMDVFGEEEGEKVVKNIIHLVEESVKRITKEGGHNLVISSETYNILSDMKYRKIIISILKKNGFYADCRFTVPYFGESYHTLIVSW